MKIFRKIMLVLLAIVVISSIGGYFYFNNKFTPSENYLTVLGTSGKIPFKWVFDETNPNTALLLPVKLKGVTQIFYMQLDFGSPTTLFYSKAINSIQSQYPGAAHFKNDKKTIALEFNLGNMAISSHSFKTLNYGKTVEWKPKAVNIIGTIGTDLLEKRLITLRFNKNYCSFTNNNRLREGTSFNFEKRRILFPAKIGNKNLKLLYDSGTSGYELITGRKEWENYRLKKTETKTKIENGNSWGKTLTIVTAPSNKKIVIGKLEFKLSEVTYIKGTSKIQNLLMKFSGMQGMIGNKLFLNNTIIIDCKNEKFKIE